MTARCRVTFEELLDYTEERGDAASQNRLRAHLETGCPTCQQNLAFLTMSQGVLRETLSSDDSSDFSLPSQSARDYARALTRLRHPVAPSSEARSPLASLASARRWVARLISDATPTVASGLRSAEIAAEPVLPQQRIFETDEHIIPLWEERSARASGSYIIGQIYGKRDSDSIIPESVLFTATDGTIYEARQEEGEFHVDGLASGTYVLQCWLPDNTEVMTDMADVIVLSDIVIGNASPERQ